MDQHQHQNGEHYIGTNAFNFLCELAVSATVSIMQNDDTETYVQDLRHP
jgi:hypothetical protein